MLLDDSSSIQFAGNTSIVQQGTNMMIDALNESQARDEILMSLLTLNNGYITPFGSVCGGAAVWRVQLQTQWEYAAL